ncbi:MAG: efflux RND transporter periplasmic adaptor subunit [Sphingobacteriaceae bacterium]
MKVKNTTYLLIAVLLGSAIVYRIIKNKDMGAAKGNKPGSKKDGPMPPTKVSGLIINTQEFQSSLSVSGSIEANDEVEIHAEVSGLVKGIFFTEGSNVSKGQLLVKINDTELQAQLKQALSKQQLATETESRAKQLLQKEAISQEEYDVAFAELRSLKAQTELIRAQLAKTALRAPFSGKIGLKSISTGEYLTPAKAIANLVNSRQVKISFSVPEKYASQMQKNTSITFTVAGSKQTHTAKIYAIEPAIEATTRALQLKAIAENPSGDLLPGLFTKIELPLQRIPDAILIPTQAIIPVLKGKQVFITEAGLAKPVLIEAGGRTDKNVLVLSGLKVGDTLLTSGMMSLKPESPVKVTLK